MHPTIEEPMVQLTPRQLQILRAIAGFQRNRRYSPTIAQLASELGTSRSTAFEHIGELRRKGLLSACPGKARSLKPTSRAHELLSSLTADTSEEYARCSTGLPLVGRVAAGSPVEAIENTEPVSLSSCFGSSEDTFVLEVEGESMIDEDIRQGDYVICRRSSVAEDGQLVVAIVDEENATLKRFYREKSRARLEPANENYEPIYSDNCRIEAVVIGLLRRL
ncbi:MAG: repressor LexA [Phycisphaerales bacterium]|nr:MAG: repressor LexA [Phycisphaerales bacterium]